MSSRRHRPKAMRTPPVTPGVGRMPPAMSLPPDSAAQRVANSRDALTGSISQRLGPVQPNIAMNPLAKLTPDRIGSFLRQVYVQGLMLQWASLVEDICRYDGQIKTCQKTHRDTVVGSPFSVEPADSSEDAQAIAAWCAAACDKVPGWDRSMGRLLLGNAQGYAIEEITYSDQAVTFRGPSGWITTMGMTPCHQEFVHNKHTRWNLGHGELLELDTGSGGFITLPPGKYATYESDDDFATRNRGYMTAAVWLAGIKSGAWGRWGVVLDLWGIPTPYGLCSPDLWQDEKRRAEMLTALTNHGRGLPSIFTTDFEIKSSAAPASAVDSRGMHAALIGSINLEISKLIIGSTLTTEISGTGSYNASETHADTKQQRALASERNLSGSTREAFREWIRINSAIIEPSGAARIMSDGSMEPSPSGIAAKLGITVEQACALAPRGRWRVRREVTPQVRIAMIDTAVNKLGMSIDADDVHQELGLPRARDEKNRIKGTPHTVYGGGLTVSTIDANEGVENTLTTESDNASSAATD